MIKIHIKKSPETGRFFFHIIARNGRILASSELYNEKLKGETIRVKSTHSKITAIGHIVKDDWFSPSSDFANIK